jgi:hypothetical protein
MAFNAFITLPDDCTDDFFLPAMTADQNCTSYVQGLSQICDIWIVPDEATDIFANFATTPTYVSGSVDNTVTDNSKAKHFVVIGELPASEKTVTPYPKLKEKTTNRVFTPSLRVLNLSDGNYATLQKMQGGWTGFTFYYADLAGYVYGKQGGISPKFLDVDLPKGGGNTDVNVGIITLKFDASTDPQRRINPLDDV